MTRYWFKPHRYGFGATPIAWQGWALAAIDLAIVLAAVAGLVFEGREAEFSAQLPWLLVILVVTVVSLLITWWKTDGSWRWRWGKKP